MARYVPGILDRIPEGCTFAVPGLFSQNADGALASAPIENDTTFESNRFSLSLTAFRLTSSGQKLMFQGSDGFNPGSFSFCLWVRNVSNPVNRVLVSLNRNSGGFGDAWRLSTAGAGSTAINFVVTNQAIVSDTTTINGVTFGNWHWLYVSYSPSIMEVYRDNIMTNDFPDPETPFWNDGELTFLCHNDSSNIHPATMASFYFWPRVLSSAERGFMFNFYELQKGSRGGNVLQRCGSSFAIRSRRVPRKQRTSQASHARNAFTHAKSNIQNLSPSELSAFETNAGLFPRKTSLGQPLVLSGPNLFSSQNIGLANQSLALNFTSQIPVSQPSLGTIAVGADVANSNIFINLGVGTVPADWVFLYYATVSFSNGVTRNDLETFVLLVSRAAGEPSNVNMFSEYQARFGSTANIIGMRLNVRMANLHVPSGQQLIRVTSNLVIQ